LDEESVSTQNHVNHTYSQQTGQFAQPTYEIESLGFPFAFLNGRETAKVPPLKKTFEIIE
jgi:hypothetical protein